MSESLQPATRRWKVRPKGSNWGSCLDDQHGRLNLLTPERVLKEIAEVKVGSTFCLSLPLDYPGTTNLGESRNPPRLSPTLPAGAPT